MATQIRIRHRGRIRMLVIAGAIGLSCLVLPASAALAQSDPYSGIGPEVLPTTLINEEPQGSRVEASREPSQPGALPVTGAEITLFVVTGVAAIRTGATLLRRAR